MKSEKVLLLLWNKELQAFLLRVLEGAGIAEDPSKDLQRSIAIHMPKVIFLEGSLEHEILSTVARIRKNVDTPIFVVSPRKRLVTRSSDLVKAGATAVLSPPFEREEIRSLVGQFMELPSARSQRVRTIGELRVDLCSRAISLKGVELPMTASEAVLFCKLVEKEGEVVSYSELASRGTVQERDKSAVRNLVLRVRRKLGEKSVVRVPGVGYRLGVV